MHNKLIMDRVQHFLRSSSGRCIYLATIVKQGPRSCSVDSKETSILRTLNAQTVMLLRTRPPPLQLADLAPGDMWAPNSCSHSQVNFVSPPSYPGGILFFFIYSTGILYKRTVKGVFIIHLCAPPQNLIYLENYITKR